MEHNHTKDRFKKIITKYNGNKKWRERYGTKNLQRI